MERVRTQAAFACFGLQSGNTPGRPLSAYAGRAAPERTSELGTDEGPSSGSMILCYEILCKLSARLAGASLERSLRPLTGSIEDTFHLQT